MEGKVVDKISFAKDKNNYDMNEVIITFKDKTFIAFEIEHDEDEEYISNSAIIHPSCWNGGKLDYQIVDGKPKFYPLIQNRIELGLWSATMEEVQELVNKSNRQHEISEYRRYLYLKEKFEGRENEFKGLVN